MTRYAIYYAPDPASAFWARASAWVGRDAASGVDLVQPEVPGLLPAQVHALTEDPRLYGFHATLKAPFRLAPGQDEAGLRAALKAFAAGRAAFTAELVLAALGRFLAFRPGGPSPDIHALHVAALEAFEPFRAALGAEELARRRRAPLSPEQDKLLELWGYPYVLEHFRFHMTLTNSLAEGLHRELLLAAAQAHFEPDCGPHRFDRISLFRQQAGGPFDLIEQVPFGG